VATDSYPSQVVTRQARRQRLISELVMAEGAVRIEQLAERFGISLMTVHRDLNDLESHGLLRKSRGVATAMSSSLVESSEVYRTSQQSDEKLELAAAAMAYIEPGQAVILDDSTTVHELAKIISLSTPLTVITNALTLMTELRGTRGIALVALGGNYYNWCNAFMGRMTNDAIHKLRADVVVMSTSAVTDDVTFHQTLEVVDTKRAMLDSAAKRILLVDHTKFEKRALHALAPLADYDVVILDSRTAEHHVTRLRSQNINVIVAPSLSAARDRKRANKTE
jgi:DeoR/GlpR family transcriptional regulator of sugar metabolism